VIHIVHRLQRRFPGRAGRITAALIAAAVVAVVLGGLLLVLPGALEDARTWELGSGTVPGVDELAAPAPGAVAEEREYFDAGSKVTMRNGLTLTIPTGWEGQLKSTAAKGGGVIGVLGRYGASENLRIQRAEGPGRRERIVISSSPAPEAQGSGLSHLRDVGAVALFQTGGGTATAPSLLVAQMHLAGAQYGAILLGRGESGDAEAALQSMWGFLRIEGAPLTSAGEAPAEL